MPLLKTVFYGLSHNKTLGGFAERYGLQLGAKSVVAGTTIDEVIETVKELNNKGYTCTIDNLGEFVSDRKQVIKSRNEILKLIERIGEENLSAHLSIKPSQLGLDVEYKYCMDIIEQIVSEADKHNIFVNFDMEDSGRLEKSFEILRALSKKYQNIGTVIQSLLFQAEDNVEKYKDFRLRIVKGAYKESEDISYTEQKDIDNNYIKMIEYHLLNGKFTSIATHDHNVINHVKQFVKENNISADKFEFQMLYGFRKDMQEELLGEGYNFCVYLPFGQDWYGYFMRRLAERPKNILLVTNELKKSKPLKIAAGAVVVLPLVGLLKKTRG